MLYFIIPKASKAITNLLFCKKVAESKMTQLFFQFTVYLVPCGVSISVTPLSASA